MKLSGPAWVQKHVISLFRLQMFGTGREDLAHILSSAAPPTNARS